MELRIQHGLLQSEAAFLSSLPLSDNAIAVFSDEAVAALYASQLYEWIQKSGRKAALLTFPGGEPSKTRETKEKLEDQLLHHGFGRDTTILAVGGGVVTDLAGFVAATYCRGVPVIMVPTTLLAMVDASLGGKNGVNVPQGKNLVGTIHQPTSVLIDPFSLRTLPPSHLRNGIAEMIKHGVIADKEYVQFLEDNVSNLLSLDRETVERAILASCRIKNRIVLEDEHDGGKRLLLNFGHTVGHALEIASGYLLAHGEAVALGMVAEGRIAASRGAFPKEAWKRLCALLEAYGLPLHSPASILPQAVFEAMRRDKKSLLGVPRIIFPSDIGTSQARSLAIEVESLLR